MNSKGIVGGVFILLGILLFSSKGIDVNSGYIFAYFWPSIFVIPLGVLMHWLYFDLTSRRGTGLLIPGGILVSAGIVCQIAMLLNNWDYMWPGFLLAVSVGLSEFYLFGGRNKWLLIPINILGGIAVLFFTIFSAGFLFNALGRPLIAIALICVGIAMFLGKKKEIHF
jgi:hypothetical protein